MESGTQASSPQPQSKSKVWIVIAVVCALAAIGLGIWAVTLNSDLDKKNKEIATLKTQSAAEAGVATKNAAVAAKELQRYRRIRASLVRQKRESHDLTKEVTKEANDVKAAKTEAANANSADEKAQANLKVAQQTTELAQACAKGSLVAINDFFSGSSAKAGAEAALTKLEKIEPQCKSALG